LNLKKNKHLITFFKLDRADPVCGVLWLAFILSWFETCRLLSSCLLLIKRKKNKTIDRFVSRRGLYREIYSDNAKTFIKASKELRSTFVNLRGHPDVEGYLGKKGMTWKFIPERAPCWGGFWERVVQTVKRLLRKTLAYALY
jgi:hypothetical protein